MFLGFLFFSYLCVFEFLQLSICNYAKSRSATTEVTHRPAVEWRNRTQYFDSSRLTPCIFIGAFQTQILSPYCKSGYLIVFLLTFKQFLKQLFISWYNHITKFNSWKDYDINRYYNYLLLFVACIYVYNKQILRIKST